MDFELSENVFSNELSEQHSSCSSGYRLLKMFSYKKVMMFFHTSMQLLFHVQQERLSL